MTKIDAQSHLPTMETNPEPDPALAQAHQDLARGLVDTDMWATPGLDADRRQQVTPSDPKTDAPSPASGEAVTRPTP